MWSNIVTFLLVRFLQDASIGMSLYRRETYLPCIRPTEEVSQNGHRRATSSHNWLTACRHREHTMELVEVFQPHCSR